MLLVDDDGVHDAVGACVGERVQQRRVDEREHGGGGADAEREREDGDGGEAGIAAECAQAVADVSAELVEEAEADGGAVGFILGGGLAKVDAGFAPGFFRVEALADEVFLVGSRWNGTLLRYRCRCAARWSCQELRSGQRGS